MLKSIYTPLSGALAQERVLELIANNMANMNTVGFKGDRVTFALQDPEPEKKYVDPLPAANYKVSFEDLQYLKGNEVAYVGVADVSRDMAQGPAIQTSNPTDFMIEGEGFFQLKTQDGMRYTRNGVFNVSPEGLLVSSDGHPVLGEKGAIALRAGSFEVNRLGEVRQDGQMIDRISIYSFKDQESLERVGNNQFFYGGNPEGITRELGSHVKQGYLEGSNVNSIKNLTDMIIAHRSYEAYQKAVSNYDRMMERSSNSIGEIRA